MFVPSISGTGSGTSARVRVSGEAGPGPWAAASPLANQAKAENRNRNPEGKTLIPEPRAHWAARWPAAARAAWTPRGVHRTLAPRRRQGVTGRRILVAGSRIRADRRTTDVPPRAQLAGPGPHRRVRRRPGRARSGRPVSAGRGGGARRQPCATAVGGGCLNQASPRADPPSRVAAAARPVASRAKRLTCCIGCLRRSRVVRVLQEPSRRGQRRLSSARRRVGFALEHSLSLREVGIGPGFGAGRGASADTSGRAPPGCWRRSRFSRAAASACRLLIEADPCCIGCASLPGA